MQRWRRRCAQGNVIVVRYADDMVVASSTLPMRTGSWPS
jgi:hypothetical protein